MTQALNLSPNIPVVTVLYRGIKGDYSKESIGDYDNNIKNFIDYGFTSFTLKKSIARTFLNRSIGIILRLTIDKNVKGIYLDHIIMNRKL